MSKGEVVKTGVFLTAEQWNVIGNLIDTADAKKFDVTPGFLSDLSSVVFVAETRAREIEDKNK